LKGSVGSSTETAGKGRGTMRLDVKRVRIGLVALLAVAAVVIGVIALLSDDSEPSSSGSSAGASSNAVALSSSELIARADSLGGPAYWVGPRADTDSYELTETADGRIYIRYLTGGAEAGDPRPEFLTIGSYPVKDAKQALEGAARAAGNGQTLTKHDGYEALSSPEATDTYVVFDEQPDVQVEVFSPNPGEAAQLVNSGAVQPLR
jgi:hypothetical protein